jgi:hypothetical protein
LLGRGAANHEAFRVLHFSLQRDHVHLLVEADGSLGFRRGVQGLAVRLAKAVNRLLAPSARFFDGWRNVVAVKVAGPIARARTWLARVGWRRHGAISIAESPRAARR